MFAVILVALSDEVTNQKGLFVKKGQANGLTFSVLKSSTIQLAFFNRIAVFGMLNLSLQAPFI